MTNDEYILFAIVILLILSAIPTTATAAVWVGWFLFILVWVGAFANKQLFAFGNELMAKGVHTK